MSSLPLDHRIKPLPPLADKLPPLPPTEESVAAPALPPKVASPTRDHDHGQSLNIPLGLSAPLTPTTPTTPTTPSSPDSKPKKANPLIDLIDTEKIYVDQLTGIIRKVAAAWSRSNLPPPELDTMFRCIESVYKANRSLYTKLKEIGANPSSPKALGDLLMRWIDDLETPYTNYATKYSSGFDAWDPVQSNPRLANTLSAFSATIPPPSLSSDESRMWTLDSLFLLPRTRLKYYRKLYSRLLKSTAPGRSDHKLLVRALDTLDKLLDTLERRSFINIDSGNVLNSDAVDPADEVVIDMRPRQDPAPPATFNGDVVTHIDESESGSTRDSGASGGARLSVETANTSFSRMSNSSPLLTISDLERRLLTDRTIDIFTMKPKVVKLQLTSPNLTFTREIRLSIDVTITFTPRATGVEVVNRRAHIILLSDLFLVCERMSEEEKAKQDNDANMWLSYPPLAGKVLRITEIPDKGNAVQVAIMRKEFLVIEAESSQLGELMAARFKECIEFSGSLPPPSKQPPPPVPPISGAFRDQPTSSFPTSNQAARNDAEGPPTQRSESTSSNVLSQPRPQIPSQIPQSYQTGNNGNFSDNRMGVGVQQMSSVQSTPGGGFPPSQPMSYSPGQVIQPSRSASLTGAGGSGYGPPSGAPMPNSMPMVAPMGQQPSGYPPAQNAFPGQSPYHAGQPPFPVNIRNPQNLPPGTHSSRPPSQSSSIQSGIRKSPSSRSLTSQYSQQEPLPAPPLPAFAAIPRSNSFGSLHAPQARPLLPSAAFNTRAVSLAEQSFDAPSPPDSPVYETPKVTGPVTSTISAQMKCKVFIKQQHAQWKSLGSARLKLYREDPTNIKQLVVEADSKDKSILISTIVLTDGVERVGKTGVAIELSDKGARTGMVYLIQLRNETSAGGLFNSLLAGSDRAGNK